MLREIMAMTHKARPRICFVPTASADSKGSIDKWGKTCAELDIDTIVLKVWVSSGPGNKSFEDILLNCDAIFVGGGNTLNMMGIWRAQGIDTLLIKAYNQGIILAGGSAGAICWFCKGISDSRPTALSAVEGLGILPYSVCPHHDNATRPALHQQLIEKDEMTDGYALDGSAAIVFRNGKVAECISWKEGHKAYSVKKDKHGKITERALQMRTLQ